MIGEEGLSVSIEITEAAAAQVPRFRVKEGAPENAFLRLGVKGGGCNGLSYVLRFDTERRPDDQVLEKGGVEFVIDHKSLTFLDGMVFDWSGGLMGQGFVFKNPNARSSCGCGKSFGV